MSVEESIHPSVGHIRVIILLVKGFIDVMLFLPGSDAQESFW